MRHPRSTGAVTVREMCGCSWSTLSGRFRSRLCGRSESLKGTRSGPDNAAECGVCARRDRCPLWNMRVGKEHDCDGCADHHAIDARSVLGTVQGSSLRSARACARPAGLDGACAQIMSWPLRDGRRCDDSQLDRSWPLTAAPSGVNLSSSPVLTAHPPREEHSAWSAEGRRPKGHDRQPTS